MKAYAPLRELPQKSKNSSNDYVVIFGELFSRGYVNGLVQTAEERGLNIIYSTVGRRDEEDQLRPLNALELSTQPKNIINIPMEAGFDLERDQDGTSIVDDLQGIKMKEWEAATVSHEKVQRMRAQGEKRFRQNLQNYMQEVTKKIPTNANVIFVHTMAGGVPRAKILMPIMNRVFKGRGDRFEPSQKFWDSSIGQFVQTSFTEVTANTFRYLLEESKNFRERQEKSGAKVRYVAYGYHGTEVMIGNEYKWQSYSPYLQGFAKLKLENEAKNACQNNIRATVFNCPEILTNSSSIFQGVEIPLYPFIAALRREAGNNRRIQNVIEKCRELLKPEFCLDQFKSVTDEFFHNEMNKRWFDFENWPLHSAKEQMEYLLDTSDKLIDMHKDPKQLITFALSEEIFKGTGELIFDASDTQNDSVLWLNHDIIAKTLAKN